MKTFADLLKVVNSVKKLSKFDIWLKISRITSILL